MNRVLSNNTIVQYGLKCSNNSNIVYFIPHTINKYIPMANPTTTDQDLAKRSLKSFRKLSKLYKNNANSIEFAVAQEWNGIQLPSSCVRQYRNNTKKPRKKERPLKSSVKLNT